MLTNTTKAQIRTARERTDNAPTVVFVEGMRYPIVVADTADEVQKVLNGAVKFGRFEAVNGDVQSVRTDLIRGFEGTAQMLADEDAAQAAAALEQAEAEAAAAESESAGDPTVHPQDGGAGEPEVGEIG